VSLIRPAADVDAARLARVHVTCWHETYDGLVPPAVLAAFTLERGLAVWGRILGEPAAFNGATVHLAEVDARVVGFASCCLQRTAHLVPLGYDGEISMIYILRAFQRHGVGAGLMHALATDLLDRGCAGGSLWVLRDNDRARRFYERCGGRVVAERTDMRDNTALFEIAYGWESLAGLRDLAGHIRTHPAPGSGA
jgi:ribosomal protein S18 acetylase RimI-like enzyme